MVRGVEEKRKRIKEIIRRHNLLKRRKLSRRQIISRSRLIKKKLFALNEYKDAGIIMFYAAKSSEVETEEMVKESLKAGKKVVLPKVKGKELVVSELLNWMKDLKKGAFGIKEPKDEFLRPVGAKKIDLVVLPGVGFDLERKRLGYGGGYYDRFLAKLSEKAVTVGLAFDLQIVRNIPLFPDDKALDKIITDKRVIE